MNCRKNGAHRTLIDFKHMSRLEKPRNIAQKRRYREHEFRGFAAVRRANRDPIYTDRFAAVWAAPPLSITIPSACLSKQRERKGYRRLPASSSNRIFALIITINISCTGSRRQKARFFAMPLSRIGGGGIDQCPLSQTRAIHRHKRSYEYCCYSCCPTSHWILVHNTFEGVVTNYRRAVD